MKKFIINVLIFTLLIFIFNLVIFNFSRTLYIRGYDQIDSGYSRYILSDSHGAALGNSGEDYGIYNFSAGSDSYEDILRKVKYLIEESDSLTAVYLTADSHMLSKYREKTNNLDRSIIFTSHSDYNNFYEYVKNRYISYYLAIFHPKVKEILTAFIKSKAKNVLFSVKNISENKEWFEYSEEEKMNLAVKRSETQFTDIEQSAVLKNKLENIILLCKENNIEVIGIKYPVTKVYGELIDGYSSEIDDVFKKYEIKIYDYKKIFYGKDYLFKDQDHLNKAGASEFITEIINIM